MHQIDKNTVAAKSQLKPPEFVSFINENADGIRVQFIGNSITRHGKKPDIGWNNDFGMAASAIENDYVHQVLAGLKEKAGAACITQVSEWERNYKKGHEMLALYNAAKPFGADIIIMRCAENCPTKDFDADVFKAEYKQLITYFNPKNTAKAVLTTSFWKHPADAAIEEIAKENGYPFVYLGDLGERDDMKAIGKVSHEGVANHPGDSGMKEIANRILSAINHL